MEKYGGKFQSCAMVNYRNSDPFYDQFVFLLMAWGKICANKKSFYRLYRIFLRSSSGATLRVGRFDSYFFIFFIFYFKLTRWNRKMKHKANTKL